MSTRLPRAVQELIDQFGRLPGIGPKMAARLAFHLLQQPESTTIRLITALDGIRTGIQPCEVCGHISDQQYCSVCRDDARTDSQICVVEGSLDVIALERTDVIHGRYQVLGGVLSPMDGIGPEQLRIAILEGRITSRHELGEKTELIIATNPSLEGEATAVYLTKRFAPFLEAGTLQITRIARGLPMGSDIEYADPSTLARALEGRNNL